jgi:hypothetical protein
MNASIAVGWRHACRTALGGVLRQLIGLQSFFIAVGTLAACWLLFSPVAPSGMPVSPAVD